MLIYAILVIYTLIDLEIKINVIIKLILCNLEFLIVNKTNELEMDDTLTRSSKI